MLLRVRPFRQLVLEFLEGDVPQVPAREGFGPLGEGGPHVAPVSLRAALGLEVGEEPSHQLGSMKTALSAAFRAAWLFVR